MAVKFTNIVHYIGTRPSKIYPKWDFGFENLPSGNPGNEGKTKRMQSYIFVSRVTRFGPIFAFWAVVHFGQQIIALLFTAVQVMYVLGNLDKNGLGGIGVVASASRTEDPGSNPASVRGF
jgi:hypothetical protein